MKPLKIAVLLALLFVAGLFAQNYLLKTELRRAFARQTGFPVEIGSLEIGLLSTRAELRDVVIRNPTNFPESTAVEIRRAYADLQPWALMRRTTHLTDLELDIPRVVVVRNAEGETNLQRLSGGARKRGGAETEPAPAPAPDEQSPAKPARERKVRIDRLHLKIGTVEYHDYRVKNPPGVTTINLNLDQEHHDIEGLSALVPIIAQGVMEHAAVRLLGDVGRSLKASLEDEGLRKEIKKLGKDLKRLFQPPAGSTPSE